MPEGFSADVTEKMGRLCDLLSAISASDFMSRRLSLCGGTALNFLHLGLARLSEDLDFNYRHVDGSDWGDVRTELDRNLKAVLSALGYGDGDIRINATYGLGRFHVSYTAESGTRDSLKVETGYMRRIPDLGEDAVLTFDHLLTGAPVQVRTPAREELFANKFVTMVSRSPAYVSARDLFDVRTMSRAEFDRELFLDLVAVECLMAGVDRSSLEGFPGRLRREKPSGVIAHLVRDPPPFSEVAEEVAGFTARTAGELEGHDIDGLRERFLASGELDLGGFRRPGMLHPELASHPQLLWVRERGGILP